MFSQRNVWPVLVGLSGFTAVAMGAAGAHVVTDATAAALVEKASLYQLIHTLLVFALVAEPGKVARFTRIIFFMGILLFSGSLYLKGLSVTASTPAAPLGGMLLMAGWLFIIFLRTTRTTDH